MYSSVCFNIWIWQECLLTHLEMHGGPPRETGLYLVSWGKVGRLLGIGVNVGLLLFLLRVWVEL